MKALITSLLMFCICESFSQVTIEHLYEVSKSYNPLFGREKASFTISLEMTYQERGDTSLSLVMDINQRKVKLEGANSSIGAGVAGSSSAWGLVGALAGSFATNRVYSFNNAQGIVALDYKSFDSLINVIDKIKVLSAKVIAYNKTTIFKVNKIFIGLDMKIEKGENGKRMINKSYYFQIDESTFKLSEDEFNELCDKSFKPLKESFDEFNRSRFIVVPQI